MSKGKNIKNAMDIIDKPVYRDIRMVLQKEDRWMTTREILSKLGFKKTPQCLKKYLDNLYKFDLIDYQYNSNRVTNTKSCYRYKKFGNEEIISKMRVVEFIINGTNKKLWTGSSLENHIKSVKQMKKEYPNINIEKSLTKFGRDWPEAVAAELFDDTTQEIRKKVNNTSELFGLSDTFEITLEVKRNGERFFVKKDF